MSNYYIDSKKVSKDQWLAIANGPATSKTLMTDDPNYWHLLHKHVVSTQPKV